MRDESINLVDALASPGSFLGLFHARVYDVIRHAPHMGNTGTEKLLRKLNIWPLWKLGDLSEQQRQLIIKNLPPRAK